MLYDIINFTVMKTNSCLSLLTTFLIVGISQKCFSQDQCKDVLEAAYNRLSITQTNSASAAAKSWFCSDKFFSDIKKNSAGGTITVPIEGVPVEFGYTNNSDEALQSREKFCQSSSSSFSSDQAMVMFSQVVEKRTIEAWENCMRITHQGNGTSITLNETVVGNDIYVTAKFNINTDADRNVRPVIIGCYYSGANEVAGQWTKGTEVTTSGIIQQFRRQNENDPVSITLQTSQGLSQPLVIKGKEYPMEIGNIKVDWEEPYQGEGAPQQVWQEIVTGDHSCYSDCQGEPTRTNYTVRLDGSIWGNGFLRNIEFKCLEGPCPWSALMEKKLLNSKVAFGSCDVWAGPMKWRLSGEWVFYETKWKAGGTAKRQLNRGDAIALYIPKKARNVRIYGKTLEGAFDYPINGIGNSPWLQYNGYTNSETNYILKFKVPQMPQNSTKTPTGGFGSH